jgi:hypothetical protein
LFDHHMQTRVVNIDQNWHGIFKHVAHVLLDRPLCFPKNPRIGSASAYYNRIASKTKNNGLAVVKFYYSEDIPYQNLERSGQPMVHWNFEVLRELNQSAAITVKGTVQLFQGSRTT